MRKLLIAIIICIFSISAKSQTAQNDTLPQYLIRGTDTVGVILSIKQAQALDNNSDLVNLFKKLRIDCDNLNDHYIQVINGINDEIALLKVSSRDLIGQGLVKNSLIQKLKQQLANSEKNNELCEEELSNKNTEIKILQKEIKGQKFKKFISIVGNAVLGAIIVVLVVK